VEKMRENKQRWFGHVMRREKTETTRVVMRMNVEGRRDRPKKKWWGTIANNMRAAGSCVGDVEGLGQGWLTQNS